MASAARIVDLDAELIARCGEALGVDGVDSDDDEVSNSSPRPAAVAMSVSDRC